MVPKNTITGRCVYEISFGFKYLGLKFELEFHQRLPECEYLKT